MSNEAKKNDSPVSFEEFKHLIAVNLQLDEKNVVPEASFLDDLMADSIKLVELMLQLDEKGISIPPEVAWDIRTVGDAYQKYVESFENS